MPRVTMFAGPNGSGKTTLHRQLVTQGLDFGHYLNADDLARELGGNPGKKRRHARRSQCASSGWN
jgi:predicted ABC-type ATPase